MSEKTEAFDGWAILELMGHRRLGGRVSEQVIAGAAFLRIDIPGPEPGAVASVIATQFYSAAAIYAITPTTEEVARAVASRNQPAPVQRWELPGPVASNVVESDDGEDAF